MLLTSKIYLGDTTVSAVIVIVKEDRKNPRKVRDTETGLLTSR